MGERALIIAIEDYPRLKEPSVVGTITGTVEAARRFATWLEENWELRGVPAGERQLIFCSEPRIEGGRGATRDDVLDAVAELRTAGENKTGRLFVYFSGHGCAPATLPTKYEDVILLSDFESFTRSSPSAWRVSEIVDWFQRRLGPGEHYYFIDACRNAIPQTAMQLSQQLVLDEDTKEDASIYVLCSTKPGAIAAATQRFAEVLESGLRGKGRASSWLTDTRDYMVVRYASLTRYVRAELESEQAVHTRHDGTVEPEDAIVGWVKPVPSYTLRVRMTIPAYVEHFSLTLTAEHYSPQTPKVDKKIAEIGSVPPQRYELIFSPIRPAVSGSRTFVDVFDDTDIEVSFTAGDPQESRGVFQHMTKDFGRDVFEDIGRGVVLPRGGPRPPWRDAPREVPFGEVEHSASKPKESADAAVAPARAATRALERAYGPIVAEGTLAAQLAALAALEVVSHARVQRRIWPSLADLKAGDSAVCVVMMSDNARLGAMTAGALPSPWQWLQPVLSEPTLQAGFQSRSPGPCYVSLHIPGRIPITLATTTLANRATMVCAWPTPAGEWHVDQYMLPVNHLIGALPWLVRERIGNNDPVRDARYLSSLAQAFRQRKRLDALDELIDGKWMEPVGALMASYELVRRRQGDHLARILGNLENYFPELPDTQALRRMLFQMKHPEGPKPHVFQIPLLRDGIVAAADAHWDDQAPRSRVEPSGTWTRWNGVVEPPEGPRG